MAFEHYIRSGQKLLRCGYTTGTCAALAAAGAARLLLTGEAAERMSLLTPKGLRVEAELLDCVGAYPHARCAVAKYAGDDADVTDGYRIVAQVTAAGSGITIDGGEGVGRVTKPGLDQPVGAAAINRVPRRMIEAAVLQECERAGYEGGMEVTISVPGGEQLAQRTFNPAMGVVGGISILGTSGIVEPMSERAIVDTIALELHQAAVTGSRRLILMPGNYAQNFLHAADMVPQDIPCVKYSNFLGEAVDMAVTEGFSTVLLVGHAGKLVKVAGGVMNTHSKWADCRREIFCAHAAICGGGEQVCRELMDAATTDACFSVLDAAGLRRRVLDSMLPAIQMHLDRRSAGHLKIGAVLFSNVYGLLGMTESAEEIVREWKQV